MILEARVKSLESRGKRRGKSQEARVKSQDSRVKSQESRVKKGAASGCRPTGGTRTIPNLSSTIMSMSSTSTGCTHPNPDNGCRGGVGTWKRDKADGMQGMDGGRDICTALYRRLWIGEPGAEFPHPYQGPLHDTVSLARTAQGSPSASSLVPSPLIIVPPKSEVVE